MNNIGLTLTADARQMIKALQDVDKATTAALGHSAASARQLEQAARDAGIAMGGMASNANIRQMAALSKQVDQLGLSSKQTAAALRGVPAQFTDIVVSLQGGQNPLTVLLQQGGQLKDMFGGIGPAARALGGYVASIINPFTLAATAVAALGTAMHQVSKEQQMLRDSIALTGGASGVTTDQLNAMAERMAQGFGATTGKAIESLAAMNQTGRIARANLEDFAQTAIIVEKRFGQTIEETAKNFAELGKDPVGASKRLNESMNFLTASTYEQIRAAVELGDKTKAATIAQSEYDKALMQMSQSAVENLGYLEKAWRAITGNIKSAWNGLKEFWDLLKSVGRDDSTAVQIQKIEAELALVDKGLRNMSARQVEALRTQLEALRETEKLAKLSGDKQAERVAAEKAGIAAIDEAEKNREKNRRLAEDAAKKAAKEAADARKAELDAGVLRNKLAEENAKREAKNLQDMAKLHEASIKPFEQSLNAQKKRVESLEQEEAAIAISEKMNVSLAQAVEMVNIAKLKEQQIDAMGNEEAVAAIQREIEEREKLVKLIGSKEARDASAKAAKQAAIDWQKASDKIQDSITDALMRGFESGKGFGKNLVDTIKNMFSTLVLRPIIQGVVGGAAGALGLGTATSAAASILGSSAAYGAAIGTTSIGAGSQAAMLAAQTSGFGTAGTLATAQAAGTGASFMSSLAAAAPYAAAGLVVLNALGAFRSKKVVGGGLTGTLGAGDITSYDLQRKGGSLFKGPSYSIVNQKTSPESKALQEAFSAMRAATAGMAKQLGFAGESIANFTTAIGRDLIHPDTGGYGLKFDGLSPEQSAKKIQDALNAANEEMARMALTTFEKVTRQIRFFGHSINLSFNRIIGPEKWMKEGETAVQALVRLSSSLSGVNTVLGQLNQSLLASSLAGADAASKLLDLFGGLQNFTQATGAYYQSFYSESERSTKVLQEISKALGAAGMTSPTTLSGFRALVEAQDLNTEAGRSNYLMLMQMAPAFAQATNAMASLGDAAGSAAESIDAATRAEIERAAAVAEERQRLQDQLDELQGNTAALRERERNALDASNRALFDQIQALQAQQEAATAAAQAEQERADAMKNAGRTVEDEIRRLRGLSGNTTNQAALQAQFATLTGMARAGDADALARLPAISQAMEEASRLTAISALDVARMRTWLSGSLSDTMRALGLDVPAFATGGVHMGGIRLVGENGPELEITGPSRIFNAQQTAGLLGGGDAASEIRAMREELAMLRAEARATAINTGRQADLMKRVTKNGEAMTVQTDLTPLEVTTA